MNKQSFLLVRHAPTVWNEKGLCQGHRDIELSDFGVKQVYKFANYLKSQNYKFEKIFTSDLNRSFTTGWITGSILQLPVIKDSRIKARDMGYLTGKTKEEIKNLCPNFLPNNEFPDCVELGIDVFNRTKDFFLSFDDSYFENPLLVISHGKTISCFSRYLQKDIERIKNLSGIWVTYNRDTKKCELGERVNLLPD